MKLLFERLSESNLNDGRNIAELRKSVMEEIARILSSRSYFGGLQRRPEYDRSGGDYREAHTTDIFNYGIPRTVDFFGVNTQDLATLSMCIKHAIARGEPRLHQVSVTVEPPPTPFDPVKVDVGGFLSSSDGQEWTHFPLDLAPR